MLADKSSPDFWRKLRVGTVITCKDEQAIEDSMKMGKGARGLDYTVSTIERVIEMGNMCEWIFFTLGGQEQELRLLAKIVDKALDVRIYYDPGGLEPGNRKDAIDNGSDWLFEAPTVDGWAYNDLKFIGQMDYDTDDKGMVTFRQKLHGPMFGTYSVAPSQTGTFTKKMIASVVEYKAISECTNPELLILEVGNKDSEFGGFITMWMGCSQDVGQLDILAAE